MVRCFGRRCLLLVQRGSLDWRQGIRCGIEDDMSMRQADDAVSVFAGQIYLVQTDDDGDSILVAKTFELGQHLTRRSRVEARYRFVRQHQTGLLRERPGVGADRKLTHL